jgi:hypothetical protein
MAELWICAETGIRAFVAEHGAPESFELFGRESVLCGMGAESQSLAFLKRCLEILGAVVDRD